MDCTRFSFLQGIVYCLHKYEMFIPTPYTSLGYRATALHRNAQFMYTVLIKKILWTLRGLYSIRNHNPDTTNRLNLINNNKFYFQSKNCIFYLIFVCLLNNQQSWLNYVKFIYKASFEYFEGCFLKFSWFWKIKYESSPLVDS